MIILGLDQAPRGIGWAHGEPGTVPMRGYKTNPETGENEGHLSGDVFDWTKNFARSVGANAIYFEQIIVRKFGLDVRVLHRQFAVAQAIVLAAREIGLVNHIYDVDVADWRNEVYAGARAPRATKAQREAGLRIETDAWKNMSLVECARRGWLITEILPGTADQPNHNVAEACLLWEYGCRHADRKYKTRARMDRARQQMKIDDARQENGR